MPIFLLLSYYKTSNIMRSMEKEKHPKAIEFGKAFATIARAHNRTPKSLHVELEVSDSYISNISTDKRIPNP